MENQGSKAKKTFKYEEILIKGPDGVTTNENLFMQLIGGLTQPELERNIAMRTGKPFGNANCDDISDTETEA